MLHEIVVLLEKVVTYSIRIRKTSARVRVMGGDAIVLWPLFSNTNSSPELGASIENSIKYGEEIKSWYDSSSDEETAILAGLCK